MKKRPFDMAVLTLSQGWYNASGGLVVVWLD